MKIPAPIAKKELDKLKKALNTQTPSDLDKNCYNRLKQYLNREPTQNEIGNMKTDANLVAWVMNDL